MERKRLGKLAVILGIGAIALTLLAIAAFAGIMQPFLCKACHAMRADYRAWEESSHNKVNCQTCHHKPGALGFITITADFVKMSVTNPLKDYSKPITAHVYNSACLRCHERIREGIATRNAINVSHKEFLAKGYKCTNCHNTVAHGDKVPNPEFPHMDKCTPCHNKRMASTKCSLCHVRKAERIVRYSGPWGVTHGRTWRRTHGMGNLTTCQICHEPRFCVRCHQIELPHGEDFPAVHGHQFLENPEACDRCHNRSFCRSCHKMEMPHPKGFIKYHSKQTKKIGKEICFNCHIPADCDECHVRHTHPGKVDPKYFKMKE